MKDGKANQHGAPCRLCGGWVSAGDGVLERTQLPDGAYGWVVEHETCPEGDAKPVAAELPRWAVYGSGRTPRGNYVERGVYFVDGERPDGDAVPVNDAAKRMEGET